MVKFVNPQMVVLTGLNKQTYLQQQQQGQGQEQLNIQDIAKKSVALLENALGKYYEIWDKNPTISPKIQEMGKTIQQIRLVLFGG